MLKCFIGLHEYEVYAELPLTNMRNEEIGKVIVNRCKKCGHLQRVKIYTNTTLNNE